MCKILVNYWSRLNFRLIAIFVGLGIQPLELAKGIAQSVSVLLSKISALGLNLNSHRISGLLELLI